MNGAMGWSFRAGQWYGVFGPRLVLALPPSQRPRVAELWELVDGGAGFEETLDALVKGGLSTLPGFVLASESSGLTRVLARGAVRVRLTAGEEVVRVEGDAASVWTERGVPEVTRLRIDVEDGDRRAPEGALSSGLVRLSGALHPPAPPPTVTPDHDGRTRHPAVGRAAHEVDPPRPPVARLLFGDGSTVAVDRVVLVGRAPDPARVAPGGAPHVVVVDSPRREISATHLEIRPGSGADHGAGVVTDLGSTNGTVVVQPDLPPQRLRPGVACLLVPGTVVDLGDGVRIRVLAP